MEAFIELMMKNLTKNGFPNKRVSFGLERLYELADDRDLSLNKVLDELVARGVAHNKTNEKIIFEQRAPEPQGVPNLADVDFSSFGPDFLSQAQAMMGNMSEDELASTRAMVQAQLQGMSDEERAKLFEQIKGMGLG